MSKELKTIVDRLNERRDKKDGTFTLVVGLLEFLGEGSSPFEAGDDEDPERRARVIHGTLLEFSSAEEAEEAGEKAIRGEGATDEVDSYAVAETAQMRFMLP